MLRSDSSDTGNTGDSSDDCADPFVLPCIDDVGQHSVDYRPLSLKRIHGFCHMILRAFAQRPECVVVVGPFRSRRDLTNASLLVGSFLMLVHNFSLSVVTAMLEPLSSSFEWYKADMSLQDVLSSLEHARKISWIDFEANFLLAESGRPSMTSPKLDMDEFNH